MRTNIPEKLIKIGDDIQEHGSASLTRLTVLKKWFEGNPERLQSFSIFIANRASTCKGKTAGEAADLFLEARSLLKPADIFDLQISPEAAESLYHRLISFQNEHEKQRCGAVRIIKNHNLFLVEEGLRIFLRSEAASPSDGYRLAANYCENYDSRYGNGLHGQSLTKLNEIVRHGHAQFWMHRTTSSTFDSGTRTSRPTTTNRRTEGFFHNLVKHLKIRE